HDRREDGVRADGGLELFDVDKPVRLDLEIGRLEALALELAEGVEHGLVLGLLRDQVLALGAVEMRRTFYGQVVALGGAGGPDDLFRVGVDERRDVLARFLGALLGFPAEGVRAARGVAEDLGEVRDHLLRHARVDGRGRGIVEIDGQLHYAATFSLKSLMTETCLPVWCATRSASVTEER